MAKTKKNDPPPSPADDDARKAKAKRKGLLFAVLAMPILIGFYATLLWWSSPRTEGRELRLDQYITLLRQGRISSATILETDNRISGTYDRGKYWVAVAAGRETIFARLTSALEDAGVPLKVQQQPLKNLLVPAVADPARLHRGRRLPHPVPGLPGRRLRRLQRLRQVPGQAHGHR